MKFPAISKASALKAMGISTSIAMALLLVAILPIEVLAQSNAFLDPARDVPPAIAGQSGDIRGFVVGVINFLLGFLGLLAVILVIYAGFLYVTDAGGDENIGKAKNIILYAIIGLVIIFASYAIVNFAFDVGTAGNAGNVQTGTTVPAGGTL